MASTSEVGHAKNVANLQDLIAFVNGYGTTYSPTKASLKPAALQTLYTQASADLAAVIARKTNYNDQVNARVQAFAGLRELATRLISIFEVTEASKEKIADAKSYNIKLQGKRASKPAVSLDPNTPAPQTNSTSQQSYDQIIQHFEGLISVLKSEPSYTPNEPELQITTLEDRLQKLKVSNEKVSNAQAEVSNARIARNKTLYLEDTGLVDITINVKKYIKALFGTSSPEYGQVKGITFTVIKL